MAIMEAIEGAADEADFMHHDSASKPCFECCGEMCAPGRNGHLHGVARAPDPPRDVCRIAG